MKTLRKPDWLKITLPAGPVYGQVKANKTDLATVCEEARCPNLGECWNSGTATFMLLGATCTRACRFCSVETEAKPAPPDPKEAQKVLRAALALKLNYLVLTTVDRDDLADQGAGHLAKALKLLKEEAPKLQVEMLFPDFQGNLSLVDLLIQEAPKVLGHNLETVKRLSSKVRDKRASYEQSLQVLAHIKKAAPNQLTKSSLLLGLGEGLDEVRQAMDDLREAGVDFLTLGQYLQPHKNRLPVERFVRPEEFERLKLEALDRGFSYVASGPLVRSSYKAFEQFMTAEKT